MAPMFVAIGILTTALNICTYIPAIYCITTIVIGVAFYHYRRQLLLTIICCFFWSTIGSISYFRQITINNNFYNIYNNQTCSIKGTISDIDPIITEKKMQKCTLTLNKIRIEKNNASWKNEYGSISLYLPLYKKIEINDGITIMHAPIITPRNNSFINYMIKENILHNMFFNKNMYIFIYPSTRWSIKKFIYQQKIRLLKKIKSLCTPNTFILFCALFMGYKNTNKEKIGNIIDVCKKWGIVHFFARSGLHLVILIFIWFFILSLIPLSAKYKTIILINITILYWLLTFSSISFIRALLTTIYHHLCLLLKIRIQTMHALTLVTLAILINNPMQLFFLDFQLSFGLTYALGWFNTINKSLSCNYNKNY